MSSHAKSKAYAHPIATQADDLKYKTKYKELKAKIGEVEEDNTKLQIKILKSKKAIQRLRVERSILYDRLQSTATPTNPFALHSSPHLSSLPASSSSAVVPPTILDAPSYPLADPAAPDLFLQGLDAKKLAQLKSASEWGARPVAGVVGEGSKRESLEVEGEVVDGGAQRDQMQVDSALPVQPAGADPAPVFPWE